MRDSVMHCIKASYPADEPSIATARISTHDDCMFYVKCRTFDKCDKAYLVRPLLTKAHLVNPYNLVLISDEAGVYINGDYSPALIPISIIHQIIVNYELPVRRFVV